VSRDIVHSEVALTMSRVEGTGHRLIGGTAAAKQGRNSTDGTGVEIINWLDDQKNGHPGHPQTQGKICEDLARRCIGVGLTQAKV
jgi:hypothetical protein